MEFFNSMFVIPATPEQFETHQAQVVEFFERSGAPELAQEYLLWAGRDAKRMKGIRPEEKMDDRPALCKRSDEIW